MGNRVRLGIINHDEIKVRCRGEFPAAELAVGDQRDAAVCDGTKLAGKLLLHQRHQRQDDCFGHVAEVDSGLVGPQQV